ncbi:hypothetical protein J2847_001248 [Azospirillum agricola]|uniref:hypothetical protein n=1 Tax=Azospirillum agricola TaxID=1720247 RepID=UPI001AE510C9|nr:hypothetical protein [Azospirillum agricola]MBP2227966.1 hypothetical protein [Azospirillum agricola]
MLTIGRNALTKTETAMVAAVEGGVPRHGQGTRGRCAVPVDDLEEARRHHRKNAFILLYYLIYLRPIAH